MALYRKLAPAPDWFAALGQLSKQDRHLHVLCPAGIGDFLWIWSKWGSVAARRKVTFYAPEGEQQRAGQYAALVGAKMEYLGGLTTPWVWDQSGAPEIPEGSGWLAAQANRHLEAGEHLSSWYPELPLVYGRPRVQHVDKAERGFVLVFTCQKNYMRGNLPIATWVRICRHLQQTVGRVRFVGAGLDVPFVRAVRALVPGANDDLLDRPLEEMLAACRRAEMCVGLAGGPTIAMLTEGCPAYFAYPSHLGLMPGTWEPHDSPMDWCYVRDLEERVLGGVLEDLKAQAALYRKARR